MEEDAPKPSPITMILYVIDNGERNPSQNWEIIPKKKYTIGRSKKEVDLPLNIKLLSRKHAELIYYDSKTIMIKDLNSRNGTFINKVKIEPLKETFFTNKQKLSFGNTNNEIIFFDKSEQQKEDFALTDSEKSQKSESGKKIEINKENEKILKNENLEEINTDIKLDKRSEKNIPINNQRKERESEKGNEDKMNERGKELIDENNNYERYNKNSKEPPRQIELERDKNKQHSISNRDTFKNKREYSREREEYSSSYGRRSEKINLLNKNRKSHQISNKSDSRKANYSHSRSRSHSGSRETLVHQNNRVQKVENPQEKFPYNKENNSYDLERERLKREYDRGFANYERRQEEEEENLKRKERERDRERDRKRDRERERERERNNYYDDERRRDYNRNNYFEEGNRILLRPEKLDIVMNQNYDDRRNNIMNKEDDMGFIKCYVEGYMYLKIRRNENN
jgi:pSer/pThr/pTyr-binding forkhead associated (FHA) protein